MYATAVFILFIWNHRLLQNNAIGGSIPTDIGRLERLQTLDLSDNQFTGSIPASLSDLTDLNYL